MQEYSNVYGLLRAHEAINIRGGLAGKSWSAREGAASLSAISRDRVVAESGGAIIPTDCEERDRQMLYEQSSITCAALSKTPYLLPCCLRHTVSPHDNLIYVYKISTLFLHFMLHKSSSAPTHLHTIYLIESKILHSHVQRSRSPLVLDAPIMSTTATLCTTCRKEEPKCRSRKNGSIPPGNE